MTHSRDCGFPGAAGQPFDYIFDESGQPFRCTDPRQSWEFHRLWGLGQLTQVTVLGDTRVVTAFLGEDLRRPWCDPPGPPLVWETWISRLRKDSTLTIIDHIPTSTYADAFRTHFKLVTVIDQGLFTPSGRVTPQTYDAIGNYIVPSQYAPSFF